MAHWGETLSKFALVGAVGTLCQYVIFILLNELTSVRPYIASIISAINGAVVNYLLNYHWTFSANIVSHRSAVFKTAIMASGSIFLNGTIVYLLEDYCYYLIAQICATLVVFFFNYFTSLIWIFKFHESKKW